MRVFDFDNTIYDGESGMDLFIYFFKKDPKGLLKYAPKFLEGFVKYKRGKITIDEVMNEYGTFLKEYCLKVQDVYGEFETFWDQNQDKIKKFYYDMQNENDVIISACPVCLLKVICDRIGIKNYLGSDIDPVNGTIKYICYKEKKVEIFKKAYGDIEIDELYTDSMSDKPLMDISKNVYMVDGDKIYCIKKDGISLEN